jgi:hypothetical protein
MFIIVHFFYWLNALPSTSFNWTWIFTLFIFLFFTHHIFLEYFDFFNNDCVNLCRWSKVKHLPFFCIFLVIFFQLWVFFPFWLMVRSFNFPFYFISFSTCFEVIIKWYFGLPCTFMNTLGKEFERRYHMLVVGLNNFLWSLKCLHVCFFPWRWNIVNVHKFSMDFKGSIAVITM